MPNQPNFSFHKSDLPKLSFNPLHCIMYVPPFYIRISLLYKWKIVVKIRGFKEKMNVNSVPILPQTYDGYTYTTHTHIYFRYNFSTQEYSLLGKFM